MGEEVIEMKLPNQFKQTGKKSYPDGYWVARWEGGRM
jgi:hypothetical protein